jgi:hypothetical protein
MIHYEQNANGRNPSNLRKQYCNSQQQIERQDKRKPSTSEANQTETGGAAAGVGPT